MTDRLVVIAKWFESLTPATLVSIGEIYAEHAHFKDPFNDLHGIDSIVSVYQHMFDGLDDARFEIEHVQGSGNHAFLVWRFRAHWRGRGILVNGSSHLRLDEAGLIADHRDYWDTGEELYEKIPVLAGVLRLIRKRMAAPPAKKTAR